MEMSEADLQESCDQTEPCGQAKQSCDRTESCGWAEKSCDQTEPCGREEQSFDRTESCGWAEKLCYQTEKSCDRAEGSCDQTELYGRAEESCDRTESCDQAEGSCDRIEPCGRAEESHDLPQLQSSTEAKSPMENSAEAGTDQDGSGVPRLPAQGTSPLADVSSSNPGQVIRKTSKVKSAAKTRKCKSSGVLARVPSSRRSDSVLPKRPGGSLRNPIVSSAGRIAPRLGKGSSRGRKDRVLCPVCRKPFKTLAELKDHFKGHPPAPQDLRCSQRGCAFTAQDLKRFNAHLRKEHKATVVTCSYRSCHLVFPNSDAMSRHFRGHFPFHCVHCDLVSSNTRLFSQHQKSHRGGGKTTTPAADCVQTAASSSKTPTGETATLSERPLQCNKGADVGHTLTIRLKKRGKVPAAAERGSEEENKCDYVLKQKPKTQSLSSDQEEAIAGAADKADDRQFKTHMCPECKRCFKKRTHLGDHLRLHFPDPNLQCPNCRKFFTSRSKLKIHMMREAGDKAHRCPLCDYSSVEKNALNRHMASTHEGVSNFYTDTYTCPVCQESFKLSQALKDHMKGHAAEQSLLFCFNPGCNQVLSDRKEFLRHVKDFHGIQAVECQYHACSMLFKSREEMEAHRKNHYAFHCQECDFVCSNKHAFRKHKKRGHPGHQELACRFCPYKSFNPVEYDDHVGKMHASEKIHRCDECDFATAHKRVLIRHELLHTGEKPHKCSKCNFTCRDVSYLSKHMLTHSEDKNYMCTECGYVTKWKHYLNVHMRKHSGDLRYHCNQCSYRCHRADQLSSHKLRHQGKTLICEVCGFGCKRKSELRKHVQLKHSQSAHQMPVYQCQHCNYQTRYKQTLRNHENGKHTKHREFRCALCPFRTFSNTSLFFHKRKAHGYVPGDKDWLERYASKQREISNADLLFPYKMEAPVTLTRPQPAQGLNREEAHGHVEENTASQGAQCLQVDGLPEPTGDPNMAAAETLLAAITLEPVETCSLEMEDFPVRLELAASSELLVGETSVTCGGTLPERAEILCFSETLAVDDHMTCGQDFEEEAEDHEKLESGAAVHYNAEPVLCEIGDQCEELPDHVSGDLELQPGDLSVEVQESWADVVKGGVQLTIVCESSGLAETHLHAAEPPAVSLEDDHSRPESILKALRKQDKEQAETLVLEGRVQMLVVQSKSQVYRCEKCSYITKKKACIVQHAKNGCSVRKAALMCPECGASFKQQRGLNTHILKKCPVTLKKRRAGIKAMALSKGVGQEGDVQPRDGYLDAVSSKEAIRDMPESNLPGYMDAVSPKEAIPETSLPGYMDTISPKETIRDTPESSLPGYMDAVSPKEAIPESSLPGYLDAVSLKETIHNTPESCLPGYLDAVSPKEAIRDTPESSLPGYLDAVSPKEAICDTPESGLPGYLDAVSPKEAISETSLPENCLKASSPLSACEEFMEDQLDDMIPDGREANEQEAGDLPAETPRDRGEASPSEGRAKYRFEDGKFRCSFCSYSCSRECTINCHVNENCRGVSRISCRLCLAVLRSETALKKHNCTKRRTLKRNRDKESDCESSGGENDPNSEEDERHGSVDSCKSLSASTGPCKLSCPTCPFACSQERAMRTHEKKGCLKPGELQCPLCSFRCMSTAALNRHRDLHRKYSRSRAQLECKLCDFTCKQPRCLKQHVRIRHEGVKPHRCKFCDFSTTRRYRLEAHESLHTGVGRIACDACNRTFGTNSKLRLHQRRVHEKKPTHFCNLCDYSGYSQNDVARHLSSCHSGELVFPCGVCQATFSSEAALKQHSLRKHQEKETYQCAQCLFSCRSQATLRCHVQKHHLQLECPLCKKTFTRRQELEEHRKSHFSHHCQQCPFAAKDRQQLVNHYAEEHESAALPGAELEEGALRCPFCSFSCRHQLVYDHHVKGHGATRLYKCSDCQYSTRNKQKITWHSRIHTGEKPYKCHLCTYACGDPSRLKYHMRIHKDEKNYLCPECGYKCKWVNQLKYHMTKHTGLKPYQCEECNYCTNRADALRVHRETRHRETRSFICEQCGKAFKTRFLLKTHLKKHSEDKPYVCNVCQRGFRWPAGLRHHYLTHTNQQPFFCRHCPYRAKQKFQVVKHLQRHHPDQPGLEEGVGKEPYLFSIQGRDSASQHDSASQQDSASRHDSAS